MRQFKLAHARALENSTENTSTQNILARHYREKLSVISLYIFLFLLLSSWQPALLKFEKRWKNFQLHNSHSKCVKNHWFGPAIQP